MDQALLSLAGRSPHAPRHEGDLAFIDVETTNQGENTGLADLTPDQIDIILHPTVRSNIELDWPAGPRLATVELQLDDTQAVSSQNVGPFLESHTNGLVPGLMLPLSSDHSLLLSPQAPEVIHERTGSEMMIYERQDAALTPLTEIDEALTDRAIRGLETRSNSETSIIMVFPDGTWVVVVVVWLIN